MTSEIFTKWLKELDRKLYCEKRKICMFIDNCTAHCEVSSLKAIKLIFLPPNTISKLQPCDQGIIRCVKFYYRKEMIRRAIDAFDKKISFQIDLLEALTILRSAWRNVSQTTIQNCFRHAGFALVEVKIQESSDELNKIDFGTEDGQEQELFPNNITFEDYVTMDDEVLTTEVLN